LNVLLRDRGNITKGGPRVRATGSRCEKKKFEGVPEGEKRVGAEAGRIVC